MSRDLLRVACPVNLQMTGDQLQRFRPQVPEALAHCAEVNGTTVVPGARETIRILHPSTPHPLAHPFHHVLLIHHEIPKEAP